MKIPAFLFFLLFACFSINAWAETPTLNDEIVLQKLAEFDQAILNKKIDYFENNFDISARFTINSRQRDSKYSMELSRKDILEGKLFEGPNEFSELERIKTDITYYNQNTQALLAFKMVPKKGSSYRKEKGYAVETEMLFQVVKGQIKIMKMISNIDLEPNYQAAAEE